MKFFCAVAFVCLLQGAFAQITVDGECPTGVLADDDYDNAAAAGRWYINEQIPWSGTVGVTCGGVLYEYSPSNITVTLEGVLEATKEPVSAVYPASLAGRGLYDLVIMGTTVRAVGVYYAPDTITFVSCMNNNQGQSIRYTWILTREAIPSEENVAAAKAAVAKAGFTTAELVPMNQQNCQ